ncbi:MAG: alpha/beta fold hydrolase, partial [Candidatus Cryptobacteroides sp.]
IIGLTWLLGGDAVTADIFNWLSTHWLPNIIFFLVFMVFAASFFGAFEIVLPSKWVNGADKKSGKKGLGGVFFLALTLVLVSFSCTGPIVGTVLIESTEGEFWTPMITMLAFSIAFALPFTIFALFPSLLNKLPQSGGWLNSVKVVLGFIEIALGLKFLSTADQVYHWGILNREIYLAIWIVCFTLLGLYLLGKIRFKHDSPVEYISVKRLFLAIIDFAFVIYLIPGMWGAPLSAISGYLPPLESQEFVLNSQGTAAEPAAQLTPAQEIPSGATLTLAHGLKAFDNLEDGLAEAKRQGKPLFVDITGHGCVNCREMEAKVWSDPRVQHILREDYVLCALYMDDKSPLPEDKWIVTSAGKTLKQIGRANSYIVKERFGVNAQPNYALLSPEGELLVPIRGYDLNVEEYIDFLNSGLKANNKKNSQVSIQGSRGKLVGEVVKVSDNKAPLAIICHGLTGNRNETFLLAVVDELSKRGISSVRFDFNGHGESEGAFSGMTVSNELEDLEHIYDYVCSLDWVDKSRISLIGHSQGGLVSGIFAGEKGKRKIHSVALLAPAACIQYYAQEGDFFGIDLSKNLPDSIPFWGGRFLGKAYVEDARELNVYERSLRYKGPETIIIGSKDSPDLYKYAHLYSEKSPSISFQELPGLTHCFEEDIHTPARLTAEFIANN